LSRCYALGANSYVAKPPTPDQLEELAKAFKWYWLEYNQLMKVNAANRHSLTFVERKSLAQGRPYFFLYLTRS
jgi:hypothetical protein